MMSLVHLLRRRPAPTEQQEHNNNNDNKNGDAYSKADYKQELLHGHHALLFEGTWRGRPVKLRLQRGHGGYIRPPRVNTDDRISVQVTIFARISRHTEALVAVHLIRARAAIKAGIIFTLVDILATILARKSRSAVTLEVVDKVMTTSSVCTGPVEAVVHVLLTEGADKARNAPAFVVVHARLARASMETGSEGTVIQCFFARGTSEVTEAHTLEPVELVHAPPICTQK